MVLWSRLLFWPLVSPFWPKTVDVCRGLPESSNVKFKGLLFLVEVCVNPIQLQLSERSFILAESFFIQYCWYLILLIYWTFSSEKDHKREGGSKIGAFHQIYYIDFLWIIVPHTGEFLHHRLPTNMYDDDIVQLESCFISCGLWKGILFCQTRCFSQWSRTWFTVQRRTWWRVNGAALRGCISWSV